MLEAFSLIEQLSGKPQRYRYVDDNRIGDHICYYSDLSKLRTHYPEWEIRVSLNRIFEEIWQSWQQRS